MKSGRIFWGVLLVAVGVLFLLDRLFPFGLDTFGLWRLWPLVLIFWGLVKVFRGPVVKAVLVAASALVVALILHGLFAFSWIGQRDVDDDIEPFVEEFHAPLDDGIERASLVMEFGAGALSLRETTEDLMNARAASTVGRYFLDRREDEHRADLRLGMQGRVVHWPFKSVQNRVEVRLHPDPAWELDIDAGAARIDLDTRPFRVDKLTMDIGAASARIVLGDRSPLAEVRINAGASSVRIEVPHSVGCEVRLESGLTSKRLSGFDKAGDNLWRTRDFEQSASKIYIRMDAGASSVKVARYKNHQ